jgi:hypothetical protein
MGQDAAVAVVIVVTLSRLALKGRPDAMIVDRDADRDEVPRSFVPVVALGLVAVGVMPRAKGSARHSDDPNP